MTLAADGRAESCAIDAVPAATLLLPYFEVDLDDPSGVDTFFSVNSALEESVLTHVVVWTDMSVEALDFNVYLTGYDVQTVGLGLILRNGVLPRTATTSAVSPKGPYSGPHPSDPGCAGVPGRRAVAAVPPRFGEWTFWGRCAVGLAPGAQLLDFREPLPSTFAAAYFLNEAFSGGTDFLVWRDSIFDVASGEEDGLSCAAGPSWYPLRQRQVVFFDENENPNEICSLSPCPEEEAFSPLESQRVVVAELGVAPQCGWAYLNLNQSDSTEVTILAGQAWVTLVQSAEGRYGAGLAAIQLDSVCDFSSVLLGPAPDFPTDEGSCPAQHGCPCDWTLERRSGGSPAWVPSPAATCE